MSARLTRCAALLLAMALARLSAASFSAAALLARVVMDLSSAALAWFKANKATGLSDAAALA